MKKYLIALTLCSVIAVHRAPAAERIPPVLREFRAAWVATVANIDWPSAPGLSSRAQQQEIIAILDKLRETNMNAVVLQVRPHADAMYPSDLEPWSYYLTGSQGKAPDSLYDPLEFWIREAHARGIELHAWFNPYRAGHPAMRGGYAPNAIMNAYPECVRRLADSGYYWMDPAMKRVQDHSFAVIMDVVKRYDLDGVQFDDYFYPYREYNMGKDFPDDSTYAAYQASGGKLVRDDWRRDAVNQFVERVYKGIKHEKAWVKFGISPFGVCRPGSPEGYGGSFDQYATLYADTQLWWNNGWVDYFSPQLYWPISRVQLSYPMLLKWWTDQNTMHRHLWPGLYLTAERSPVNITTEIVNQIMVTRAMVPEGPGTIVFSMKGLLRERDSVVKVLKQGAFATRALVPASPWLDRTVPNAPTLRCERNADTLECSWKPSPTEQPFLYVLSVKTGEVWTSEVLTAGILSASKPFNGTNISAVAISAVDRTGNESVKAIVPLTPGAPDSSKPAE